MKDLKTIAKKAINNFVEAPYPDSYGWPPACSYILYQPERPVMENSTQDNSQSDT